jgi:hypothetical protein
MRISCNGTLMHRTVVFNRSVFSRAFVVTGRCGFFAFLACVVFFSIPKLPSYLACFSLCPLGFEACSFLMENSYLHPILCGNGKIRNFLILAWAIFLRTLKRPSYLACLCLCPLVFGACRFLALAVC